MPSDDRDRQLEKALARYVRSTFDDSACPDAETLAAYQDGTLLLEEMARCKQHIAACPRCQETLALVEESPVVEGRESEIRKMIEPASERLAAVAASHRQWPGALSSSAAPVPRGTATKPAPMRAPTLGWVVAVGGLAAALLVWVASREVHQYSLSKPAAIATAENHPSQANVPAPSLSTSPQGPPGSPDRDEPSPSFEALHKQNAAASAAKSSGAVGKKTYAGAAGPARAMALPDQEPDKERESRALQSLEQLSASRIPPAPTAPREVNDYAGQNRELPPAQAVPPAPRPNVVPANHAPVSGGLVGPQNQKTKMPNATTENLQVSTASVAISQSLNDVLPEGGVIIMAPVDAYSWRVGPRGKIEHSTDGSRTWMLQKSGVTADLTAGSATSGKVCWVVGKGGTILLTSDRGRHWKELTSPTKEDLAGVNALDEKRASIWTASRTKSFETNDAGVTWTPVGNK
jgi:hypothetical protein